MTDEEYLKARDAFRELMDDGNEVFLYLREGSIYREVKGKITEVGDDFIKLDTFNNKKIPMDCINPNQV